MQGLGLIQQAHHIHIGSQKQASTALNNTARGRTEFTLTLGRSRELLMVDSRLIWGG